MGIVVRQSVKSVIVTLFGVLLGALVTFLSSRFFPKAEYGFTLNLVNIVSSITLVALMGFTNTILIIGQKYPIGHRSRSSFLAICALVPLLFTLIICAGFFIFKQPILNLYSLEDRARIEEYFVLFPLFTLISVAVIWMEGYLQSLNKVAIQTFFREVLFRIFYVALIVLYALNVIDYQIFIWIFVLIYLIPLFLLIFTANKIGGFVFRYIKGLFSFKEILEITRFSAYHMMTMVSMTLIYLFSTLLLGTISKDGLEAVAVFGVASFVIAVLRSPTRIIGVAVMPTFSQTYQEGRIKDLQNLYTRSAISLQMIGIAAFALVYLNINGIQEIMSFIQKGYGSIKGIILILMIGQLSDMVCGFNYELIGITKYFRFNFWLSLFIMILVYLLNYLLIKDSGVYGAAWATSTGVVLFNIIKTVFLWRKYKIIPFNKSSFSILIIGVLAALFGWLIPEFSNVFVDLILRTGGFCLVFGFFILKLKISPELNTLVSNVIKNKRLF